ncbi:type II toxin-antitoxin system HicB family antitoxin [Rhodoplanes elegans]|uniref:type II toxin-antitoxin system HicB family antitoxin n=1 Tax=Rhodoplanes elegans TaxID=29408 RepID=UPI001FD23C4A|nr:type II toxin-antitoxin system HicB family antitoxin [Rhodoplanes elegans]
MSHYIALIHKDRESCYGVSFPDVPGVITAGDTSDEAMRNAAAVLVFAAEDWSDLDGAAFQSRRTIDALRRDPAFRETPPTPSSQRCHSGWPRRQSDFETGLARNQSGRALLRLELQPESAQHAHDGVELDPRLATEGAIEIFP